MVQGGGPADAGVRAAPGVSVFGTIHPQLLNYGAAALQTDMPDAPPVRLASVSRLESTFAQRFAPVATDNPADQVDAPATTAGLPSFDQRFGFTRPRPPTRSLQPQMTFADRFAGAIASGAAPIQFAMLDPRASIPAVVAPAAPAPAPVAAAAPAPHAGARALAARVETKRQPAPYRVASIGDTPIRTAYASPDTASKDDSAINDLLKKFSSRDAAPKDGATKDAAPKDGVAKDGAKDTGPFAGIDMSHTAIYDIAAHVVYLPNGTRLEAHSGLGEHMDEIRSVSMRSLGPTPPGMYDLTMRESRFHGIDAIRLNPADSTRMYGRAGILAHPYMLGPNGQSNGCVSLRDYDAFLAAFRRGEFNRLAVVERLDDAPGVGATAAGWISDKLKGIFGRS
jgi:hypothetical protein